MIGFRLADNVHSLAWYAKLAHVKPVYKQMKIWEFGHVPCMCMMVEDVDILSTEGLTLKLPTNMRPDSAVINGCRSMHGKMYINVGPSRDMTDAHLLKHGRIRTLRRATRN